jgi:ketosteroid isomerase-like protein
MKYLKLWILLSFPFCGTCQANIDGLVKTERSFAAYAVAHGIKPSFLRFADSNAVLFDNGKSRNAIELWNERENRPGILNWMPDYVEIAASHDFGYTTGPWTFQQTSMHDSIAARGRFITVWHITQNGEWKFLVDLGVANVPAPADTILQKVEITDPSVKPGTITGLRDAENDFITIAKQSLRDAYTRFISSQVILNRNGMIPCRSASQIQNVLEDSSQPVQLNMEGSGMASSGDLGYAYGSTVINGKSENYLHIWRKEKEGWKLAVEVLRF